MKVGWSEGEGILVALREDPLEGLLMCWEQHMAGRRNKLCDIGLAMCPLWSQFLLLKVQYPSLF